MSRKATIAAHHFLCETVADANAKIRSYKHLYDRDPTVLVWGMFTHKDGIMGITKDSPLAVITIRRGYFGVEVDGKTYSIKPADSEKEFSILLIDPESE